MVSAKHSQIINSWQEINVIAIQNYGTSGTLFLQSLLDNHPQVLITPALYSRTFYYFWRIHGHENLKQLISSFVKWHSFWFSAKMAVSEHGLDQMGKSKKEAIFIKLNPFQEYLEKFLDKLLEKIRCLLKMP